MSDEFPCLVRGCEKAFNSARALGAHHRAHSDGVACPVCGKKQKYLSSHLEREHPDDPLVVVERGVIALVDEVRSLREENERLRRSEPHTRGI